MANYITLTKVSRSITKLVLSPDGNRLAFANAEDWVVRVWDLADRVELGAFTMPSSAQGLAFHPDNKTLCVGLNSGDVEFWDTDTEKKTAAIEKADDSIVHAVAYSPDGTLLATSGGWTSAIKLWDAATRELKHTLESGEQLFAVGFTADGKTVGGCGGDGKIVLFLAARGKAKAAPASTGGGILGHMAFSPDGNFLAVAGGRMRLIDLAAGGDRVGFVPPTRDLSGIAFAADGSALLYVANSLVVADAVTGEVRKELDVGSGCRALAVAANGKAFATGDSTGHVCVWDTAALK